MATGSYHTAGIWSADTCGARVLTSSKDGSVTAATLTPTGIAATRVFDEHHAGIVKCVRARDAHVFADCGADGLVCVLDDRVAGSGVVSHFECHTPLPSMRSSLSCETPRPGAERVRPWCALSDTKETA